MATVIGAGLQQAWKYLEVTWTYADPRSEALPLVKNPSGVAIILSLYLLFVCYLGPRLMADRKPIDLSRVMLVYNAVQVVSCAYLFIESFRLGWGGQYNYLCEPLSTTKTPHDYKVASVVWCYFILKIVDLLDTVFMVLRKNLHQISFLHVYHHAGMVAVTWFATKFVPGGHHTLVGVINCLVHCVLYGYYFLSLHEPRIKSAWWKRYITIMQIVQFGFNVLHETMPFLIAGCGVDRRISFILVVQNFFMFALFSEFYEKNYGSKKNKLKSND